MKVFPLFIIAFIFIPLTILAQDIKFAGGDGSPESPWQISTPEQLDNIREHMDDHFELINDIDLSGTGFSEGNGWMPIGSCDYNVADHCTEPGFTGLLDGNLHTIYGLYIDRERQDLGLFGSLQDGAVVVDVNLENADIQVTPDTEEYHYAGALAAVVVDSEVFAVNVSGDVSGYSNTGGAIGLISGGMVQDVHADVEVRGQDNVGGLIGRINDNFEAGFVIVNRSSASGDVFGRMSTGGLIGSANEDSRTQLSFATGDVDGSDHQAGGLIASCMYCEIERSYATGNTLTLHNSGGGLVGWNLFGSVSDTYATGDVFADHVAGGLIGLNDRGDVINSYSIGEVQYLGEEGNSIGGLIGGASGGSVQNSFWNTETSGHTSSDGGTGLNTEEMRQQITFTDAGWDFDDEPVWLIENPSEGAHSFPYLFGNEQSPPPGYEEIVSAGSNPDLPSKVTLEQNYPNPFNPSTLIQFSIPETTDVTLQVFNILGQHVSTLVNGQLRAGRHEVRFDATGLSSGVYMYRIETGNQALTKRMLFVK